MIDGRRKPASFALRASFDGANCRQSRAKNLFYPSRGEKSFEKAWGTPSASSKAKAEAFASRAASFFQLKKRSRPPIFSSNSSLSLSLLRAGIFKTHLTNQRKKAENAIAPRATATWERTAGVIVERRGKNIKNSKIISFSLFHFKRPNRDHYSQRQDHYQQPSYQQQYGGFQQR